jgi:arylsulfatase A-like enzyme
MKTLTLLLALCSSAIATAQDAKEPVSKPNVILILIDDMGWSDVGFQGNEYYETPNIDRLASQGVVFSNGYAANAVCSPSRAAILTGRYPTRHGITNWIEHWIPAALVGDREGFESDNTNQLMTPKNDVYMKLEEVTIAEVLKDGGYETCHIGKWHLGPHGWLPQDQGFDHNIGGSQKGSPSTYFDPYNMPNLRDRKKGEYLVDRLADEATNFIKRTAAKDQPFFLYLSHYAPHYPLEAKAELIEYYKNKPMPKDRSFHPEFAAMVHSVDESVGKVLATLDASGIADDTIVFFTSDNGGQKTQRPGWSGPTDNTPMRDGKGFPYEGGIREPFIVKWPGTTQAGRVSDEMVNIIDILPTICEMTGQPLPAGRVLDGISLVPLLKKEQKLSRDTMYWHLPHYWGPGNVVHPYSAIRKDDWKLIHWYEGDKMELYNLAEDVSETNNMAAQMQGKVKALSANLDQWLKDQNAVLPIPNPMYRAQ